VDEIYASLVLAYAIRFSEVILHIIMRIAGRGNFAMCVNCDVFAKVSPSPAKCKMPYWLAPCRQPSSMVAATGRLGAHGPARRLKVTPLKPGLMQTRLRLTPLSGLWVLRRAPFELKAERFGVTISATLAVVKKVTLVLPANTHAFNPNKKQNKEEKKKMGQIPCQTGAPQPQSSTSASPHLRHIRNRRKRYLIRHPSYLSSPSLELAG
jgi:hypothetical protein